MLDKPIVQFKSAKAWEAWLSKHYGRSDGVWLRFAKKASGIPSPTYDEALDVALCWGWIDGLKNTYDDKTWVQRFTPRRPRSKWSKRNQDKIQTLTRAGRMKAAGLKEVENAKRDGRWARAYGSPATIRVPPDLRAALAKNPRAKATFATLLRRYRYAILFRLWDAKRPETRKKRLTDFVARLARGEAPVLDPGAPAQRKVKPKVK